MKRQRAKNQHSLSETESARAYAFLLLKFRLRSEKELLSRLKQKGFSEGTSKDTVNFLKEKEFINDRFFAKGWALSRLKRPFGIRRIRQELIAKGLDKEIIEETLGEVKKDYNESRAAEELARQRFSRLSNIEPQKAKARVYAYLLRRGFLPDVVNEIIRNL